MRVKKKRCEFCLRWYWPDARTWSFQKACSARKCRANRVRRKNRRWILRNPGYQASRRIKTPIWARNYPDYWRQYRRCRPEYARKDIVRRVRSRKNAQLSAKQTAIAQKSVEALRGIQEIQPELSAKHTAIDRRVEPLIQFLIWKEQSAKQTNISLVAPPGVG